MFKQTVQLFKEIEFLEVPFNGNENYLGMVRFNADGTRDPSFNAADVGNFITVLADGKILTGGGQTLSRLNSDGSLDSTFSRPVVNTGNYIYDVIELPDGKLMMFGNIDRVNGQPYPGVVRLNVDGTIDPGFQPGRDVRERNAVADGAGGLFFNILLGSQMQKDLVHLHSDGSVDDSFRVSIPQGAYVNVMAIQPDGRVVMSGNFTQVNGQPRRGLARVFPDGSLDDSFQPRLEYSPGNAAVAWKIIVQPDGAILCLGDFQYVNGVARRWIARLHPDGSLDEQFNPVRSLTYRNGNEGYINTMATGLAGHLAIGGNFERLNGIPTRSLALFEMEEFVEFDVPQFDAAGKLHLSVFGRIGGVYKLERSADLQNWFEVETRTATAAEIEFQLTPPDATHQYFRVRTP